MAENSEKYSETARTGKISIAEETALLGEDGTGDDGDADSPEITMQGLAKMMNSMNENMAAVASSFALLGSSLKRSRDESNSSSQTNKKQKTSNDPTIDDDQHTGDESDHSSHSDSAELRAIMAPKDETTTSTVEPSNLLSQIASDFDKDENTSGAVTEKLAEIVHKRFSAPLGEEKLKEKLGQYLRPDNCAKLAVPKVNPEIWMKLNRPASRQDLHMASIQRAIVKAGTQLAEILLTTPSGPTGPDLGKLLTMNADAVTLLGHATHQLSMHRRQAIKPFLNKEYATLCSPQGPVIEFLFGDELQSQLNNIKASNKIGNTMASESPRSPAKGKKPWKNKPFWSFFGGGEGAGRTGPRTDKSNGERTNLKQTYYSTCTGLCFLYT
jgi:flagellar motor protein MotB